MKEKHLPLIPSLNTKDTIRAWMERRDRMNMGVKQDRRWLANGDRGLSEFADIADELFPFLDKCIERLGGRLKLVTFGDGRLEGTFQLVDAFEEACVENRFVLSHSFFFC